MNLSSRIADVAALLRQAEYRAGLYPAQWAALRYLALQGDEGGDITGFAQYHRITMGTASTTITTLVGKGYVLRAGLPAARKRLFLTEKGRRLLESDPLPRLDAALAERLGDTDRVRLWGCMDLARQALERELRGDGDDHHGDDGADDAGGAERRDSREAAS